MPDLNIPADKKLCLALYWVGELLNLHCIMVRFFSEEFSWKVNYFFLNTILVYLKTDTTLCTLIKCMHKYAI